MIRSGLIAGVAFGHLADGDARTDTRSRAEISRALGIGRDWAIISQVHGDVVRIVAEPGQAGEADGLVTDVPGLPIAIATADCVPVAIAGDRTIALVHAGWRGVAVDVVGRAVDAMASLDDAPRAASIGPHIRACCYEVGDEVIEAVGGGAGTTRSGTQSVDLEGVIIGQLGDIPVETFDLCTKDDASFASYRRNRTTERQVAVAWL